MSETPTKEQLDKMKANARNFAVWAVDAVHGYTCEYSADPQRHVDEYARHEADFLAVIDMALGFLAMQPRPISEAPKDTALLVIEKGSGFPWEIAHFNTYRKAWVRNLDGVPISIPTHFIPLTSLQEPSQ